MRRIVSLLFVSIFTLCLFSVANAQYGIMKLGNGITIVVKTEITPSKPKGSLGSIYSSNSGNTIHRILTDKKNKIYFGYDLSFEKEGEEKFRVSIKPLSKTPDAIMKRHKRSKQNAVEGVETVASNSSGLTHSTKGYPQASIIYTSDFSSFTEKLLPNYPKAFVVNDGDTISLDLLENPKTKAKITDIIKISSKSSGFGYNYSEDKPIRDFSVNDVYLRIETPDIYINQKKSETNSSVAGNINWIYIKGKGRFIFSFKPQPNYTFKKIGVIRNNKLSFEFKGDKYEFVSKSPILGQGGNWNLWVMHDPSYKPNSRKSKDPGFAFGAAGKVEYLFQRK